MSKVRYKSQNGNKFQQHSRKVICVSVIIRRRRLLEDSLASEVQAV